MVFKRKFQQCQKKSSSLFEQKNRLIRFELWTVAMETYFAESAKNCEQQSFVPVNQSSFLRLLQMVFKRKFERCQKKSSSLCDQKNGLIPFELWTVLMETYFAESSKNCEQQSFAPVNQSSFLRLPQMVFKRKFQQCQKKSSSLFEQKNGLIRFELRTVLMETYFAESSKNCEQQSFAQVNKSSFLRLLEMEIKRKFQRCQKKSSSLFEYKNGFIRFELWTVAMETNFAESAKNCEKQSFAPVNQSSFPRLLQMVLKRKFQQCQKKSSSLFEQKNGQIPFELWTVAMETYFAESAKNCEQHSFAPVNHTSFLRLLEMEIKRKFQRCQKKPSSFFDQKNGLIRFELWTVAMETYFAESAKNCERQSFAPVNQSSFLRLLEMEIKRKFQRCQKKPSSLFEYNNGLIPFELWTVLMETYFAESAKYCEQQSFAPVNESSFLRILQMVFKRKFQRCQKKLSSLFEQKNGFIPFELWTVAMETYFAESSKNCEQQSFAQVNQSSFLRLLQMEIKRKFQRCQKKSSSLFEQKNSLIRFELWTVAMETQFVEFAKNCEQQSFAPVNQSSFLRILQMVFKRKFQRCQKKSTSLCDQKNGLIPFELWTVLMATYFAESSKNCEQQSFAPVNQSSFLRLPQMVFKRKFQQCQKKSSSLFEQKNGLIRFELWTVLMETYFAESSKNCEQQSFAQVNQSSFLRLLEMEIKRKFQRCQKKSSSLFEYKNGFIRFELWTVAMETYFAESAKNCEQQSFAPVNQSSFPRLLQMVLKRKFQQCQKKSSSLFEQKNGLIRFELWTVAMETYFAESSKNCEQQSFAQVNQSSFLRLLEMEIKRKFQRCQKKPSSLFDQKNGLIRFELWTVAMETYFAESAKNCERQSFAPVNQSSFLRLLEMEIKRKFQRCQKKPSSLFDQKNGLIRFELWTVLMETYFAESSKNCEQQSFAQVNQSSFLRLLQMEIKRKFQRCQKKSSSLFEQKNSLIRFELWTVAMETYFAESAKNCEQQSFVPVNQSSFLRLLQMVFKRKFERCQKKSSSLCDQKNGLIPFELWTVLMETYFAESSKNCEQQSFAPVNQSSFLRILQMEIKRKFQRCQKKQSSLFDQKNGFIRFELWTVAMETYFTESAKNCEQQSFAPVNQSSFPRLLQMVLKRKFQRCQKKSSSLFEYKNGLIPFELWTVAMETYFAESAKNCEQQSFAPVNQSSFLRLPQMVFKRKFEQCQKKSSSLFEQKNGLIRFELWTVLMETYFAESSKNCEQQSFAQVNQSSFLRLLEMEIKRKFQRCQKKPSSLFDQKNGFIRFELWTVAMETYFTESAKNCEQQSFVPVNQSSFLRLPQMVFKRKFEQCQKKSSSLFEQKNGLIRFELWTVLMETYFAESSKNCEQQSFAQVNQSSFLRLLEMEIKRKFQRCQKKPSSLFDQKNGFIRFELWTVAMETYFTESAKNCEQQSFVPVNQSSFLRLPQMVFKRKFEQCQKKSSSLFEQKNGLIRFELWTVLMETYFAESSKNCEQQSVAQVNQSSFLRLLEMEIKRKFQRCQKKQSSLFDQKNGFIRFELWTVAMETYFTESAKNCEQQSFAPVNQSSFPRLLQMVLKRKFQRCQKKSSSLFEYKNGLIPFELWTVAMETYFAESAKNCEQQSFAPVNQSSFLRLPQMVFKRKFEQCQKKSSSLFEQKNGLIRFELWTVLMETYFAESSKNCEQQSFAQVNQSSFLRLLEMEIKRKFQRCQKKPSSLFDQKNGFIRFELWTVAMETYFTESAKNCEQQSFVPVNQSSFLRLPQMVFKRKFEQCQKKSSSLFEQKNGLIRFELWTVLMETYFAESSKNCEQQSFAQVNQSSFLRLLEMEIKRKFQRCQKKPSSLFDQKNGFIRFELWTVAMETYFTESAKNCEQQSFVPVNQSSFLRLPQMVFKRKFEQCQKKSSSLFEQKNGLIRFELWTVLMETYFAESSKNCEQQSFAQVNQSSFLRLLEMEIKRKFQRCQKKPSSLFDQKNGLIRFELWTVAMETYFAESAKNCERQSFAPVNQSSFLRLLEMEIKRKFQRCQKKPSSLFDQKNGLIRFELWTVLMETYFAESSKNCEQQSFAQVNQSSFLRLLQMEIKRKFQRCQKKSSSLFEQKNSLIRFELWTVAMETYFAESAKNCEQQSFVPVNQSSFLRLLQMVFKRKFERCQKKSSSLCDQKNGFIPFELWTVLMETYFAESSKNCEQQSFAPVNQSSFLRLPQMVFKRKFQQCQKKSSSLFEQKNGLIRFELWTVLMETYFAESSKNCEQQSFAQVNQSSFLRLLEMEIKQKFQRCQKKSSSLFEYKNGFIRFELWTVAMETYFAESAKNCEQQSFAPVNQSSFPRLLQMVLKRKFQQCQKKSSSLFEQKNGLIRFELWTVAMETYFAESSKNCEQQSFAQVNQSSFLRLLEMEIKRKFQRCQKKPSSLFDQKNGLIRFELWTVAMETYFAESAKNCERQSFAPVNQSSFLRLLEMEIKRKFQRCQKKPSSLFDQKNGLIRFELWTVLMETYFAESSKNCEQQSFAQVNQSSFLRLLQMEIKRKFQRCQKKSSSLFEQKNSLIRFELWTVAMETYFAESAKNCEQQSFVPVNQSSFLRLLQMVFKRKFERCQKKSSSLCDQKNGLIPFELWTVLMETYFAESSKNCEQQSFAPVNQSSFLRLPQMVFKRKFQQCQKKSSSLFEQKNGLIRFELWTVLMETYFAESSKNCEQQSFAQVNQSSFLRLLEMEIKRKFQRCQKKSSSLFEYKNGFIRFELWTVAMETYFAESAKNCEQQSFAPVNQSSFPGLLQMVLKRKFQQCQKKSSSLFEQKNGLIRFELWTVAMETYFAESAKNCEQHSFAAVNQSSFLRLLEMEIKRKFQRCQKKISSLFDQKNGLIRFELWTVAMETYFAESAKNCERQSFAPVNQSSFLRLLEMEIKRKFQRCQKKPSSLFEYNNGLIPFELWTVLMETYFAESAKYCEQQSFAPVNESSFLRILQMVFKRKFQRCQKKLSSLFEQKNGFIPFELWTVAMETYFAESSKIVNNSLLHQ